jgi:hypothetical protein
MNSLYEKKYLKYKQKYIELKIQHGGISPTILTSSIPQFIAALAIIPRKKFECSNQTDNNIINETTKEVLTGSKIRLRKKIRQSLCYNGIYNNKLFNDKIIIKLNDWVNSLALPILETNIYNGELFSNIRIQYFKDTLNGITMPTLDDIRNLTNIELYKKSVNKINDVTKYNTEDVLFKDINNNKGLINTYDKYALQIIKNINDDDEINYYKHGDELNENALQITKLIEGNQYNTITKYDEKDALQFTKIKVGQNIRALLQMAGVTTFKTHIQVLIDDIISFIDCANNYGGYKVKNMFKQQINYLEHSVKKKIKKLRNSSKGQDCDKANEYINLVANYKKYDDLKKHYNYNMDSNDFDYVNMECLINLLTKENRLHLGDLIRIYLLAKYPENKDEIIALINNNIKNSNKNIQTLSRLVYLLENTSDNCENIDKQFII